jgi:hypothetical protein
MNPKNFALRIAGTLFGAVAILHLLRIITGASVLIDGWELPVWVNWMGLLVGGFICGWLWSVSFSKNG